MTICECEECQKTDLMICELCVAMDKLRIAENDFRWGDPPGVLCDVVLDVLELWERFKAAPQPEAADVV